MSRVRALACLLALLSASALALTPSTPNRQEAAARAFVEASNRHDVDAMVAAVDPQFRWLQVEGDRISTEVVGAEQLRSWLEGYFRSTPDARSSIGHTLHDGRHVSTVETVEYTDGSGQRQRQAATSIYEFASDGRIRTVWYFPAQPLPAAGAAEPTP